MIGLRASLMQKRIPLASEKAQHDELACDGLLAALASRFLRNLTYWQPDPASDVVFHGDMVMEQRGCIQPVGA